MKHLNLTYFSILGLILACSVSVAAEKPAQKASAAVPVPESLTPEQEARKIEVCGKASLIEDSIGNFSDQTSPWFPGNAKVLFDPHEAYLARVILIQKAKISIDISTFTFNSDEATFGLLDELRKAIRRGVKVRFLADAFGSVHETLTDQYRHLRTLLLEARNARTDFENHKPGSVNPGTADVVIFHPFFRFRTIQSHLQDRFIGHVKANTETSINWDRRSHDKIFMIDKENPYETYAIVGGRNFEGSYFSLPLANQDLFEDIDVLLSNDMHQVSDTNLSNTLGVHYQNLFCSKGNRWLKLSSPSKYAEKLNLQSVDNLPTKLAAKDLDGASERLMFIAGIGYKLLEMKGASGFDFVVSGFDSVKLWAGNEIANLKHKISEILVNPHNEFVETLPNGNSIYQELRSLIRAADRSIDVCTPYVFVAKNERECLKKWVMEKPGRRIRLLSNSAATTDSLLTLTSFHSDTAPGLMLGDTYECHRPKMVNGKPVIENGKAVEEIERGVFDNRDLKIQVYELGKLDNKLFEGEKIDGKPAIASYFYGKLHAKFGIIDGRFSFVGSDNFDPRSRHLNSETTMFIDGPQTADKFTEAFQVLMSRSYLYGSPELHKVMKLKTVSSQIESMRRYQKLFEILPEAAFAN